MGTLLKLQREISSSYMMEYFLEFLGDITFPLIRLLCQVQNDLQYIKEDLGAVEKRRIQLCHARERCSVKLKMLSDDPLGIRSRTSSKDRSMSGLVCNSCNTQGGVTSMNFPFKKDEGKAQANPLAAKSKEASLNELTSHNTSHSGSAVIRKKRVHAQVSKRGLIGKPLYANKLPTFYHMIVIDNKIYLCFNCLY